MQVPDCCSCSVPTVEIEGKARTDRSLEEKRETGGVDIVGRTLGRDSQQGQSFTGAQGYAAQFEGLRNMFLAVGSALANASFLMGGALLSCCLLLAKPGAWRERSGS